MIITLGFVNGFQQTVSEKVFSFWGHIRVQYKQPLRANIAEEIPITENDSVTRGILQDPRVASIHAFATKYAILKTTDQLDGVLLKGLARDYDSSHLNQFMKAGRWMKFNDSSYSREIILSTDIANRLQIKLNDRILIYFIRPDGSVRPDKLEVVGLFKTGIDVYDKTFAIGDLQLIQKLNGWAAGEIGGYEIFLKDYKEMQSASEALFDAPTFPVTWDTETIRDIYPNIFDWLQMQNTTRNLLIGFMLFVAIINLVTCLLILVLERVHMIGVLKALGARNGTIQQIFLQHTAIITGRGILIGTAFALAFLWLQKKTGFIKLNEEAYYMSTAAVSIHWYEVVLIAAGTLLVCALLLIIPTLLIRRLQPVKAIRFN